MKLFALATILISSLYAQAKQIDEFDPLVDRMDLAKEFNQIYSVEAKLIDAGTQQPNCPRGAVCDPGGFVKLSFTLEGCLDGMGPVDVTYTNNQDNKLDLVVHAYAFKHVDSARVKCAAPNIQIVTVPIGRLGGIRKADISSIYTSMYFSSKK